MTKQIITAFCLFALVLPSYLWAAETTMMVKLQQKIKGNMSVINQLHKDYQARSKQLNDEIQGVIKQLENEDNADQQEHLTKIYLKTRAEGLHELASATVEMKELVINTVGQMERLQSTMQDNSGGVSPISLDDKQSVSNALAGMAREWQYLQQLDPNNPQLIRMASTMKYNYTRYKKLFGRDGTSSLQDQIDHMADVAASLQAALNLMDEQRKTLLQNVYYVVQGSIVRFTNDLMVDIDKMLVDADGNGYDSRDAYVMDIYTRSITTTSSSRTASSIDVSDIINGL